MNAIELNELNRKRLKQLTLLLTLSQKFPRLIHLWRFAVGTIYALSLRDRISRGAPPPSPRHDLDERYYTMDTKNVIESMKDGSALPDDWLRGFYYNSAVMRLDAMFARLFKAIVNDEKNDDNSLYERTMDALKLPSKIRFDFENSPFGKIRAEVQTLRGRVAGCLPSARETTPVLEEALDFWFELACHDGINALLAKRYGSTGHTPTNRRDKSTKKLRANKNVSNSKRVQK